MEKQTREMIPFDVTRKMAIKFISSGGEEFDSASLHEVLYTYMRKYHEGSPETAKIILVRGDD